MLKIQNKQRLLFRNSGFGILNLFRISNLESRISFARMRGGQAMLIAALFFLLISMTVTLGIVYPVMNHVSSVRTVERGAESLYAAEGAREDVAYRLIKGMPVDAVESISLGLATATATTTAVYDGKEIAAAGNRDGFVRKGKMHLSTGTGVSFNYGIQSGDGGIILENSSSILGNAYSNGPITGAGSNLIKGSVISAGPAGLIDGVHATSSAYAHTISDSTIDGDAYYATISNTTVGGALHPGSPDQATSSLPISDAQISDWKNAAALGGTLASPCPYKVDSDVIIGPKKIACDLEITGDPTVTLAGALWVSGNITIKNTALLKVASSLGASSVPIIADNPSNQTTSSKISLENSAQFQGSGSGNSYILFVSQNKSAEQGGTEAAIAAKNSVDGDLLLYAGHGEIQLENSIDVKEVTAWRIQLKDSAEVLYESGLANLIFTSGPSGGYTFDMWREVE